jgi:hypothetical protein
VKKPVRTKPTAFERQVAHAVALAAGAQWITMQDIELGAHVVARAMAAAYRAGCEHTLAMMAASGWKGQDGQWADVTPPGWRST